MKKGKIMTTPIINRSYLLSLQARASVLALAEVDPARAERHYDDAHDLLTDVIGLLEENGLSLIEDPDLADKAFSLSHLGLLREE